MKKGGAGGRKGGGGPRRSGKGRSTGAALCVALAAIVTVGALILLSQQLLPMVAQAGTGPTPAVLPSTSVPKRTPVAAVAPASSKAATPTAAPLAAGRTQPPATPRAAPTAIPAPAATVGVAGKTPTATPRAGAPAPTPGGAVSPTATAAAPAARATVPAGSGEIISVPTSKGLVALTFDAGSDLGATLQTLEVLRARGVRSTFFITGSFAEKWPAVVKQMASDGHELGNHSYSHPDFTKLSDKAIRQELAEAEDAIARAAGRVPIALVRTPYGSRDARVLRVIGEAGYRSVYWALDSADWRPEATPEGVADRVLKGVGAGDVVVQHCSTVASARGLPAILEGLNRAGLVPVTVGSLLSEDR